MSGKSKLVDEFNDNERWEGLVFYDGLDDAFLGICEQYPGPPIALYDRTKAIEILAEGLDGDMEGAIEYFEYNVAGAFVGEQTPAFLVRREELLDDQGLLI